MFRRHLLFVLAVVALLSSATSAQVPNQEKFVAGAERAFEKRKLSPAQVEVDGVMGNLS